MAAHNAWVGARLLRAAVSLAALRARVPFTVREGRYTGKLFRWAAGAVLRAGTRGLYVDGAAVQLVPPTARICGEDFTGPFVHEQPGPELIGDQLAVGIDWRAPSGALTLVPAGRAGRAGRTAATGKEKVMPGAIIIGVGPGIGLSVARRFARGGMPVSVIARTRGAIDAATETLRRDGAQVTGLLADSTDEDALRSALETAEDRYGVPDVLVYNAALVRRDRLGELSTVQLLGTWAVNVGGAVTAAAHTGRRMAAAGHGTLIITGGLPESLPESFSLSLGKAGVRTLAGLLDQELGPSGVHVTTVTVYGGVVPGSAFDPDEIAETYWQLYRQPRQEWTREVAYTGPAANPRSATGKSPS